MTVEMFQNINTNNGVHNNKMNQLQNNNFFKDPDFLNFTGGPISSDTEHKHFANEDDYFKFVCEYKRTAFSLSYNIIKGIIGLFLAYRTAKRSNGLGLGLFLFFYTIVVLFKLFEIGINLVLNKEESKKICKKYYLWFYKNRYAKIILSVIRWITTIIIIIVGIGSLFTDVNLGSQVIKNNSINNRKNMKNILNNRNYRNNNKGKNNKN